MSLPSSMAGFVPCDRLLQKTYSFSLSGKISAFALVTVPWSQRFFLSRERAASSEAAGKRKTSGYLGLESHFHADARVRIWTLGSDWLIFLQTRKSISLVHLIGNTKRKWGDREGGSRSSPWDMSCPRKLFLDERKSSETSACRPTSVRCLKENIYSSAFHVRHHFLFSLRTWERGKTACGRLRRQTFARTKTSARLKITFVDITYPGQRLVPPSLSPYFLLVIPRGRVIAKLLLVPFDAFDSWRLHKSEIEVQGNQRFFSFSTLRDSSSLLRGSLAAQGKPLGPGYSNCE